MIGVIKLEKGNNLKIFCSTTAFEGVKQIIENTASKINEIEHVRNEYQEGRICSEITRVKEKESTVNIYWTKSRLLVNGPQMKKFILEVIPIIQLWVLENKTAIDISDQKLKRVLSKSKIEKQLLNKIEGQKLK